MISAMLEVTILNDATAQPKIEGCEMCEEVQSGLYVQTSIWETQVLVDGRPGQHAASRAHKAWPARSDSLKGVFSSFSCFAHLTT